MHPTKDQALQATYAMQAVLATELAKEPGWSLQEGIEFAGYFDIVIQRIRHDQDSLRQEESPFGIWQSLADSLGRADEGGHPIMIAYGTYARIIQKYFGSGNF